MYLERIDQPCLSVHSYIVGDEKTKRCIVVDPTRHVIPFIVQAQDAGFEISDIVETHVHADFVSGAKELKHQLNGKPRIHASGMGGVSWIPAYADEIVQKGSCIRAGDLRLEAIHTPGHTPEHIAWICYDESRSTATPWLIFTGDCLFVGSVGRPDLLGSQQVQQLAEQLYHSLFDTLGSLPDFVEILPSHGAGSLCGKSLNAQATSTMGYERLFNPYLQRIERLQWQAKVVEGLPLAPPYFSRLKKLNVMGPSLLCDLKTDLWGKEKQSPDLKDLFLVDVRHPEAFAVSHLKNSLNMPPSASFCQWAGWMFPETQSIGVVVEKMHRPAEIIEECRLMGFDQPIWLIPFDRTDPVWEKLLTSFPLIDVKDLPSTAYVLDVRTCAEWETGHIPKATHIPLTELPSHCDLLPKKGTIATVCRSGTRSSLAASWLKKQGFESVVNLRGGMQAWKQAGLPLEFSH